MCGLAVAGLLAPTASPAEEQTVVLGITRHELRRMRRHGAVPALESVEGVLEKAEAEVKYYPRRISQ